MAFCRPICFCRHLKKCGINLSRTYSIPRVKKPASEFALEYFDQFYSPVFPNWSSIRLGLLCPHSYCAVVNVFAEKATASELFGNMEVYNMRDAYNLGLAGLPPIIAENDKQNLKKEPGCDETSEFSDTESGDETFLTSQFNVQNENYPVAEDKEYMPATKYKFREFIEEEYSNFFDPNINYNAQIVLHGAIHYPEKWNIYFCPRGKFRKFPPPNRDSTDLLNYYLMDGASILPVFALDIQKGEEVGDLCASPGGKSLAMLFGMQFGKLVCNDVSLSRLNKLKTVLNSYLAGTQEWSKKILVSNLDVTDWTCFEAFDKILLDVPCTNDRLSVTRDANNIFSQKRFNERMMIPRVQTSMLCAALKALKPGGSLVYSTCSLSPLQNDGVVHMALSTLYSESPFEFVVQDLTQVFSPLSNMFQFSDTCKYGQLVVPFLPLNYGPMYIAKISRKK